MLAYLGLGRVFQLKNKINYSEEYYQKGINVQQSHPLLLFNLAYISQSKEKKMEYYHKGI